MTVSRPQIRLDYYSILGLSFAPSHNTLTASDIKTAYHRTLLLHHPDKANSTPSPKETTRGTRPSVDTITAAYKTLSTPHLRREHDQDLLLRQSNPQRNEDFRTGVEDVDLDDLAYDSAQGLWTRGCRCGQERGFVVTEKMLEEADVEGLHDVRVGCLGCSLWLNVGFGVDEGEQHGQDGG